MPSPWAMRLRLKQQGQGDDRGYQNDGGQLERQGKIKRLPARLVDEERRRARSGVFYANTFRSEIRSGCRGLQR